MQRSSSRVAVHDSPSRPAFRRHALATLLALLALPACVDLAETKTSPPRYVCPSLVVGPVTGAVTRYALSGLALPTNREQFSIDLDGSGHQDNELANAVNVLASQLDLVSDEGVAGMITVGVVAASLEIQSDDPALRDDPTVAVRYRATPGDAGVVLFGALANGHFSSNPTPCLQEALRGRLVVPLLVDADPIDVPLVGTHLSFDNDGKSLLAELHGAVPSAEIIPGVFVRFDQMMRARPWLHWASLTLMDRNGDGQIDQKEFATTDFIANLLDPDVQLFSEGAFRPVPKSRAADSYSVGISLTFKPCPDGRCAPEGAPSCENRVRDGDESDVDCGGSCPRCNGALGCKADGDCESRHCAAGRCDPPTCKDGIKDRAEADVDCGDLSDSDPPPSVACPPCANGMECRNGHGDFSCASGLCATGLCAPCHFDSECIKPSDANLPPRCQQGVCNGQCRNGVLDAGEADIDCGGMCRRCSSGSHCTQSDDCVTFCTNGRCA